MIQTIPRYSGFRLLLFAMRPRDWLIVLLYLPLTVLYLLLIPLALAAEFLTSDL